VGGVVRASGGGFAGSIDLLVARDAQADRIVGLDVLGQKETPTVGDKITRPDFRQKFLGRKTTSPVVVVKRPPKGEDEIEAISGATISSRSVSAIVNEAISDLRGELAARSRKKD
jgi:electron transport complex protein RnfG